MKKTNKFASYKIIAVLLGMGVLLFVSGIWVGRNLGEFLHNLLH